MDTTVALILVESSMTWLLVSTRPPEVITMPVPAASSPLYCSAVLMITRPGSTLLTTPGASVLGAGARLLGCGIAPVGRGWGATARPVGCAVAELLDAGW